MDDQMDTESAYRVGGGGQFMGPFWMDTNSKG